MSARLGNLGQNDHTICPQPVRPDTGEHSWVFNDDTLFSICRGCGEVRDAMTGEVTRPGRAV